MAKRALEWQQQSFGGGMVQNRRLAGPLERNECEWLENFSLSEIASASKRNGYVRLNSTPLAGPIQGMFEHKPADGTTHFIVVANGTVYRHAGGADFDVVATGLAPSAAVRVRFVAIGDMLVLLNGVNAPRKYDPSTGDLDVLGGDPPVASIGAMHNHHLFLSGVAGQPTRVWYSETADPEDGYASKNYLVDMKMSDNSRVTALMSRDQEVLIGKELSITSIRGMDPRDFSAPQNRATFTDEYGIVSQEAVIDVAGDPWFLSRHGIFRLRGPYVLTEESFLIGGLVERLDPFRLARVTSAQFLKTDQVAFFVPFKTGELHMDLVFVAHPNRGRGGLAAWTIWTCPTNKITASAMGYSPTLGELHFLGDADGYVYQLSTAYLDVATPVAAKYRSIDLDYRRPFETKVVREVNVGLKVGAETTMDVMLKTDRGRQADARVTVIPESTFQPPQDTTDPLTGRQAKYATVFAGLRGLRHQVEVVHEEGQEFHLAEVAAKAFSHGKRRVP